MKIALLLALLALSACAGEPFEAASAPVSAEPLASSSPPQLWLLHRCEEPGCQVSARALDAPAARCADGAARPSCPVSSLLWPGPAEGLLPLAFEPRTQERLAVEGRWSEDGSLEILRASVRAGHGALPERWARAAPREDEGVAPLWISPLDGHRGWPEAWLEFRRGAGDESAMNRALVQAHLPGGLLLAGARKGSGARRRMVIHDYFLEHSFAPSLCGEELRLALEQASSGLLWPSETDAPLLPFVLPSQEEDPLAPAALAAALGIPPEEPSEERGLAGLQRLGVEGPGMTPEERAAAARFRSLRAVLEANLSDLRGLGVGRVRVRILLVGRSRCGELAGIESLAVET